MRTSPPKVVTRLEHTASRWRWLLGQPTPWWRPTIRKPTRGLALLETRLRRVEGWSDQDATVSSQPASIGRPVPVHRDRVTTTEPSTIGSPAIGSPNRWFRQAETASSPGNTVSRSRRGFVASLGAVSSSAVSSSAVSSGAVRARKPSLPSSMDHPPASIDRPRLAPDSPIAIPPRAKEGEGQPRTAQRRLPTTLAWPSARTPVAAPARQPKALRRLAKRVAGGLDALTRPIATAIPRPVEPASVPVMPSAPVTSSGPVKASTPITASAPAPTASLTPPRPNVDTSTPARSRGGLDDLVDWWRQREDHERSTAPSNQARSDEPTEPSVIATSPAVTSRTMVVPAASQPTPPVTELTEPAIRHTEPSRSLATDLVEQTLDDILRRVAQRHGLEVE